MTRPQIVRRIRERAQVARDSRLVTEPLEHDPVPDEADVLQTVRPRDYREVSLILDT